MRYNSVADITSLSSFV